MSGVARSRPRSRNSKSSPQPGLNLLTIAFFAYVQDDEAAGVQASSNSVSPRPDFSCQMTVILQQSKSVQAGSSMTMLTVTIEVPMALFVLPAREQCPRGFLPLLAVLTFRIVLKNGVRISVAAVPPSSRHAAAHASRRIPKSPRYPPTATGACMPRRRAEPSHPAGYMPCVELGGPQLVFLALCLPLTFFYLAIFKS